MSAINTESKQVANELRHIFDPHGKHRKAIYMRKYWKKYDSKRVVCRLRPERAKQLEFIAKQLKKPQATVLQDLAFANDAKEYLIPDSTMKQLQEGLFNLDSIARNINQIAKNANSFKNATLRDLVKARAFVNNLKGEFLEMVRNLKTRVYQNPDAQDSILPTIGTVHQ